MVASSQASEIHQTGDPYYRYIYIYCCNRIPGKRGIFNDISGGHLSGAKARIFGIVLFLNVASVRRRFRECERLRDDGGNILRSEEWGLCNGKPAG